MLEYNIAIYKFNNKEKRFFEGWKFDNPNLSSIQKENLRIHAGKCDWVEIYKLEEIDNQVVETLIYTNEPQPYQYNGEEPSDAQKLVWEMYRVAGTLD